jgi:hypothetical protein
MQNNTEPRRANRPRDSCTISVRGAHSKTDERKKSKGISSFKTRLWKITNVITTQTLSTIYELHRPSIAKLKVAQCNDVDPALPKIVSFYHVASYTKHNTRIRTLAFIIVKVQRTWTRETKEAGLGKDKFEATS